MAQFDVHALPNGAWAVNVQSDLVSIFDTKLVIPLIHADADARPIARLNPSVAVLGEKRLLATHLAGAVTKARLGPVIANVFDQELTIKVAIDTLVSGF